MVIIMDVCGIVTSLMRPLIVIMTGFLLACDASSFSGSIQASNPGSDSTSWQYSFESKADGSGSKFSSVDLEFGEDLALFAIRRDGTDSTFNDNPVVSWNLVGTAGSLTIQSGGSSAVFNAGGFSGSGTIQLLEGGEVLKSVSFTVTAPTGFSFTSISRFRSVGPSNTTALATGAPSANEMSISDGLVTFEQAQPDAIGVGDAIEYDADDTGGIDNVVFIHERVSDKVYAVRRADGSLPTNTNADTESWKICRAYTSLANAESGSENTACLDDSIEDFDTFTGGKDVATSNEQWNIALYGDAVDSDDVVVDGWTTSETYHLQLFAPYLPIHVGTSQRHSGVWSSSAYTLADTNNYSSVLQIRDEHVFIDGLQMDAAGTTFCTGLSFPNDTILLGKVSNNIIRRSNGTSDHATGNNAIAIGSGTNIKLSIWNNIIYGFNLNTTTPSINSGIWQTTSELYIFNNTIVDAGVGIALGGGNPHIEMTNNLIQGATTGFSNPAFADVAGGNLSNDATSPDDAYDSKTVTFVNAGGNDYRLDSGDTEAQGNGVDLSGHLELPFDTDITGSARSAPWSIGASNPF